MQKHACIFYATLWSENEIWNMHKTASRTNELDFRPLCRKHNKSSQLSQNTHSLQTHIIRNKEPSLTLAEVDGKSTLAAPLIDAQCNRPVILYTKHLTGILVHAVISVLIRAHHMAQQL